MSEVLKELSPSPGIIDVLKGTVSEPIQTISRKPGFDGQLVTVRIAIEGPGMFGLTDWQDNREWSGIFNHCILSARYATYFAQRLIQAGHEINSQLILDGMIVSHPGRRQWDEAGWYPEVVPGAETKMAMYNETLGLRLIKGKVPEGVFQLVSSLAYDDGTDPEVYNSWEHRLSVFADHRSSDRYLPLHIRMGDFIWVNFFNKDDVGVDVREQVHNTLGELFTRHRNFRLGLTGGIEVTADEAVEIMQNLGASPDSARSTLRLQLENLLKDVDTEAELIQTGINPDDVNDDTVPMPKWEDKLRLEYVFVARESITERMYSLNKALKAEDEYGSALVVKEILERYDRDFPTNTWWGQYAWRVYQEVAGNRDYFLSDTSSTI